MRDEPKSVIINQIIKEKKYKSYLEIGYQLGVNFDRIKCKFKHAVDPNPMKFCDDLSNVTSDSFFEVNMMIWDIILIDGSHLCEQVTKDIVNASRRLSENGCIILHDVLPQEEAHQTREISSGPWCGDVWRSYVGLIDNYNNLGHVTYNTDWGVGVIFPKGNVYSGKFEDMTMRFDEFMANRDLILNVK